jgi:hypothetical protein
MVKDLISLQYTAKPVTGEKCTNEEIEVTHQHKKPVGRLEHEKSVAHTQGRYESPVTRHGAKSKSELLSFVDYG